MTRPQVELVLTRYMGCTYDDLDKAREDAATPMLDRMIIAVVKRAMIDGDQTALGWLLDQTIGKVKDAAKDLNFNLNFSNMPREQVIEIGQQAVKYLQSGQHEEEVEE